MKLKSLDILKNGVQLMQEAIKTNPNSVKEIQSEIDIYNEAIMELERLEDIIYEKDNIIETQQLKLQVLSASIFPADNMPDKLAELEKVILDCYLAQGYQVGVDGWQFKVNISTYFKCKEIQVMFSSDKTKNFETVFRISKKTTQEMWNESIKFFNIWTLKIIELQNDKRR